MSKKDYTKYYEKTDDAIEVAIEINDPVEAIEPEEETIPVPVIEEIVEPESVVEPKVFAKVCNCTRLNVRVEPDGDVIGTIHVGDTVEIDMVASTDVYYKICTASGMEGYCMRRYITIVD